MTLQEAITALLTEFHLEDVEELIRDDAKQDPTYTGYSGDHPRVQRFREVLAVLKREGGGR